MNKVKIIEFYSNNCPNCKSFEKDYNEVAKQLKGIITVGSPLESHHHNPLNRRSLVDPPPLSSPHVSLTSPRYLFPPLSLSSPSHPASTKSYAPSPPACSALCRNPTDISPMLRS